MTAADGWEDDGAAADTGEPPRVSVVLPTHNRSAVLPRAVHSVLNQTFSDLELIVVDDGSTEDIPAALSGIQDPRLVYVRLDRRGGAAVARNAGLARARGDLIAFQDSDDEWLSSKLEEQVALLARHGSAVGAVGGRYRVGAGASTVKIAGARLEAGEAYEDELLEGQCCITPIWLFRRTLLDELGWFDERMPCLEDWDLMLRLSERTELRAVPEEVMIKRGAGDSLGADIVRRMPAMEELLRRHGARFLAHPRRNASFCLELSYLCLAAGQPRSALRYGFRALRRGGASPRMLLAFVRACLKARLSGGAAWPVPGLVGHP